MTENTTTTKNQKIICTTEGSNENDLPFSLFDITYKNLNMRKKSTYNGQQRQQ